MLSLIISKTIKIPSETVIAYITHFPCINCFKLLIASGIKTIYYNEDYKNDNVINEMALENNIEINKLEI
jgi:dCMP deaminase